MPGTEAGAEEGKEAYPPLMTSWSSAVIVKLCLVKHANSQRHVGDCDLVAEVGIGSSSNSSVGGYGTSMDHFEKQGNTWVTHTKSLQCRPGMPLEINGGCAGGHREALSGGC